jgi:hypothetical protein
MFLCFLVCLGFLVPRYCSASEPTIKFKKISNISSPSPYFLGREVLLQQINLLLNKKHQVVLNGLAGMGKSQLAKKYAQVNYKRFDIIWWIDGKKDLYKQFSDLALNINLSSKDQAPTYYHHFSEDVFLQTMINYLEVSQLKILLILDNIKASHPVLKLLPKEPRNIFMLFTTCSFQKWENEITVGPFTDEEAKKFIELSTRLNKKEGLNELVQELGNFPLALAQSALSIRTYAIEDYNEYIDLLKHKKQELWLREESLFNNRNELNDRLNGYKATVQKTFEFMLDELKLQSPLSYKILLLCALLKTHYIPESVLKLYSNIKGYDFHFDYKKSIKNLLNIFLIELEKANKPSEKFYFINRYFQGVIIDQLPLFHKIEVINELIEIFKIDFNKPWDELTEYIKQNPYLLDQAEGICEQANKYNIVSSSILELKLRLFQYYQHNLYDYSNKEKYKKLGQDIKNIILKNKDINPLLEAQYYIESVFLRSNYISCDSNYEKKIRNAIKHLEKENILKKELIRAYTNVAHFYNSQGTIEEAKFFLDKAERALNETECIYSKVFYCIKLKMFLREGEYLKANELINYIFNNFNFDQDTLLQFILMNHKATILLKLQEFKESIQWSTEAYKQVKKNYNNSAHKLMAEALLLMAKGHYRLGHYEKAEEQIKKSIQAYKEFYRDQFKNLNQAFAHTILGDIYRKSKRYIEADTEYYIAKNSYDKILRNKKYNELGKLYKKIIKNSIFLKNERCIKNYYNLHKNYFGEDHQRTINIIDILIKNNVSIDL